MHLLKRVSLNQVAVFCMVCIIVCAPSKESVSQSSGCLLYGVHCYVCTFSREHPSIKWLSSVWCALLCVHLLKRVSLNQVDVFCMVCIVMCAPSKRVSLNQVAVFCMVCIVVCAPSKENVSQSSKWMSSVWCALLCVHLLKSVSQSSGCLLYGVHCCVHLKRASLNQVAVFCMMCIVMCPPSKESVSQIKWLSSVWCALLCAPSKESVSQSSGCLLYGVHCCVHLLKRASLNQVAVFCMVCIVMCAPSKRSFLNQVDVFCMVCIVMCAPSKESVSQSSGMSSVWCAPSKESLKRWL